MLLIKQYIKELYKSTGLVAVVLPGSSIEVGDIIKFKNSDIVGRPKFGHFINISSLNDLHIPFELNKSETTSTQTHNSSSGISVITSPQVDNVIESEVSFSKSGLVYLNAVEVKEHKIVNYRKMKEQLRIKIDNSLNNCFLVTKVVIAKSAVIMQSNEANGKLKFKTIIDPSLGISLEAGAYEKQSYHNLLEKDVTLLVDLIRIKISGNKKSREEMITGFNLKNPNVKQFSGNQFVEGKAFEIIDNDIQQKKEERKNKKMFFKTDDRYI